MRFLASLWGFAESRILSNKSIMEFLFLSLLIYLVLDAIILAWFFLVPYSIQSSNRLLFGLGVLGYNWGYLTSNCHQMPQRTLLFNGFEMPFCSRDTGIYVGCLIGGVLPFLRLRLPGWLKSPYFFILSLLPLIVDGVSQTIFNLRESSNELRTLTGILFGFGLVYVFAAVIVGRSRVFIDFRSEYGKVARISAVIMVVLLVSAYVVAGDYVTLREAVERSDLKPTFVTYVSKRAYSTIRFDPYIDSYNDAVLTELLAKGYRGHGVWVIYAGNMQHEGKYVYFSSGDGRFALIKDTRQ